MHLIAKFTITLKTTDAFGEPAKKQAGIAITADTHEEQDRAFAAIRKMFPEARRIALTKITIQETVK